MGYKTKTWISKSGRLYQGMAFSKKAVRHILQNPVYAGKIQHKDQVYDGLHKAIIDEQTWQEVRDIFSGRSTKNQQENPSPRIVMSLKRKSELSNEWQSVDLDALL